MIVLVQIGWCRTRGKQPGQRLDAFHVYQSGGEMKISREGQEGQYLTDLASRERMCWYIAKCEFSPGDRLRIEVKTAYRGRGQDDRKTAQLLYLVEETAEVVEVRYPDTGYDRWPLAKGRLVEIVTSTAEDEKDQTVAGLLADEEGM